jgi:hypothetical protein
MMRYALMMLMVVILVGCGAADDTTGTGTEPEPALTPVGSALPPGSVEANAAALLSQHTGQPVEAFQLGDKTEHEWPDSSLGCPDPAALYMQVITPGYQMTFVDEERTYDVRTNEDASIAVLCDDNRPDPLP